MKRVVLFLVTNLAVMLVLSVAMIIRALSRRLWWNQVNARMRSMVAAG